MALVKKSKLAAAGQSAVPAVSPADSQKTKPPKRSVAQERVVSSAATHRGRVAEGLAAATEELARGLSEAAAAAEELRRSMDQIASGATEAAGASQEQLAAIKRIVAALSVARAQADSTRRRTDAAELTLVETATQITNSARAIERAGRRQGDTLARITELERRARDIGAITLTVSRIADRTNLLALNAAIEAARAGEQGRGFAIVADEVRALSESSEKSSHDVQRLANSMQTDVRAVTEAVQEAAARAVEEAASAGSVVTALIAIRGEMRIIAAGSEVVLEGTLEAERAASEAQKGAMLVAAAAEEQSAAANESQAAIQEQAKSLAQGQSAARALAGVAEKVRANAGAATSAEQIGSTAEELSASIQELSGASQEIMAALSQINRGAQQQAAATQQTSAGLGEIEKTARSAQTSATQANNRIGTIDGALKEATETLEKLVSGVSAGLDGTRANLTTIGRLETIGRRIQRSVNTISLVIVQTSMLAVNGSVEAARAGGQGRGFATVSNDIRNLAREASENVGNIEEIVGGILEQIASLRRDLELIIGSVETEAQSNKTVLNAFDKVREEIAGLRTANRQILDGSEEILMATVEASAGARQIAAAADQASAASRQAATASTEQARGTDDLAAAVEEIASLADELKRDRS